MFCLQINTPNANARGKQNFGEQVVKPKSFCITGQDNQVCFAMTRGFSSIHLSVRHPNLIFEKCSAVSGLSYVKKCPKVSYLVFLHAYSSRPSSKPQSTTPAAAPQPNATASSSAKSTVWSASWNNVDTNRLKIPEDTTKWDSTNFMTA